MRAELWETLCQSLIQVVAIRIYSSNFAIHELVLRCGSLKSVARQLHGIPSIVDVGEDLYGNHGLRVLRHFVYGRQLANNIVHSEPNLLPSSRLVLLLCRVVYDGSSQIVRALARPSSSSSRSPCTPDGGGDNEDLGESGACGVVGAAAALRGAMLTKTFKYIRQRLFSKIQTECSVSKSQSRQANVASDNISVQFLMSAAGDTLDVFIYSSDTTVQGNLSSYS